MQAVCVNCGAPATGQNDPGVRERCYWCGCGFGRPAEVMVEYGPADPFAREVGEEGEGEA